MAQFIDAATVVYYNANVRNNDVGDCVCRSISFAFDIPYSTAGKQLNAVMKQKRTTKWNIQPVFNVVIRDLGGSMPIKQDTPYPTVDEFADAHTVGAFLILCGKSSNTTTTSHMVCVVDGKIYDSWDCRNYFVKTYYTCSSDRHVAETDIQSQMKELAQFGAETARAEIDKLNAKWIVQDNGNTTVKCTIDFLNGNYSGYAINLSYQARYSISDSFYEDTASLRFKIACTLKPGMTEDEARIAIIKTMKQRAYDRMYTVREHVKKDVEAFEAAHQEGAEVANQEYAFFSPAEKRFINQLPGKVKPFISYIYIQRPGQYSNSYEIHIKPLPGDPNKEKVRIEAYDAAAAKDMIQRYVDKFERPYEDYSPYEDY